MVQSSIPRVLALGALLSAAAITHGALGQEIVLKNDDLPDNPPPIPVAVGLQAYFTINEEVNVWLTAPCAGTIVAIDVLWMASSPQGAGKSVENAITLYQPGTFPTRSSTMLTNQFPVPNTPAELIGPFMNGNGFHQFRFLDEDQTVPLSVPVTAGQSFVVSFEFGEDHSAAGADDPTIPVDILSGCTAQRNGIFALPGGFLNWCFFSGGDFIIRARMICQSQGACCVNSVCSIQTQDACNGMGGVFRGNGTNCSGTPCNGACCIGTNCVVTSQANCAAAMGQFQGAGVTCSAGLCNPTGACCLEGGVCQTGPMTPAQCTALGGTYLGNGSTCPSAQCVAPFGACCLGKGCLPDPVTQADCALFQGTWAGPNTTCGPTTCPPCFADQNHSGVVDVDDLIAVILAWGPCNNCAADVEPPPYGNNQVNVDDLIMIILSWGPCH